MPSTDSEWRPPRWEYHPDQLGELPEDWRPPQGLETPDPTPCRDEACPNLVAPRWWPGRRSLGMHGGQWHTGGFCLACQERQRLEAERRKLGELAAESGIPARYTWPDFERHLKQARDEVWPAFRDRLDQVSGASQADGMGPFLGITAWNAPAAMVTREWRPGPDHRPRPPWLFLTGPVGSGKTTLAAAAFMGTLRHLAGRREDGDRYRARWTSSGNLWETLRLEVNRKGQRGALARWATADVLVLDDLGTLEQVKAWHRDAMEYLICERYNGDRPTLITSNLRLDSEDDAEPTIAALYGERVASRLVEALGGRRHGTPRGYLELLGMDWRADVPHAQPDPTRAPSPSAGPSTPGPSTAVHHPRQLALDWKSRAAGEVSDD